MWMTSAFSKASVFAVHTDAFLFGSVFETRRFQMSPLWRAFSNICLFDENAQRCRVDDRRKRIPIKSMLFQAKMHQCGLKYDRAPCLNISTLDSFLKCMRLRWKRSAFLIAVVWTIGENVSNSLRFQTKTDVCGRGDALSKLSARKAPRSHYRFRSIFPIYTKPLEYAHATKSSAHATNRRARDVCDVNYVSVFVSLRFRCPHYSMMGVRPREGGTQV